MANSIQAIRNVYDIAKGAKDNESPMSDEEIIMAQLSRQKFDIFIMN